MHVRASRDTTTINCLPIFLRCVIGLFRLRRAEAAIARNALCCMVSTTTRTERERDRQRERERERACVCVCVPILFTSSLSSSKFHPEACLSPLEKHPGTRVRSADLFRLGQATVWHCNGKLRTIALSALRRPCPPSLTMPSAPSFGKCSAPRTNRFKLYSQTQYVRPQDSNRQLLEACECCNISNYIHTTGVSVSSSRHIVVTGIVVKIVKGVIVAIIVMINGSFKQ